MRKENGIQSPWESPFRRLSVGGTNSNESLFILHIFDKIFFKRPSRSKEKYDTDVKKLKDLYARRDEERRKALLQAVEKSGKSYEEIMAFLNPDDEEK